MQNTDSANLDDLRISLGWLGDHSPGQERDWELAAVVAVDYLTSRRRASRAAYLSDLRDYGRWLRRMNTPPLDATRQVVERYGQELEGRGLAPATIARRLSALNGYYKYGVSVGRLDQSPSTFVSRPTVPTESMTTGLTRTELADLIQAAEAHSPRAHVMCLLLGLNGLRVSEVTAAEVSDLDVDRDHRVLHLRRRKGGKRTTAALPAITAAAIDGYVADRVSGPIIVSRTGRPLDRTSAGRILRHVAAGTLSPAKVRTITPHVLRHTFCTLGLDAGVSILHIQDACSHSDTRTTLRYAAARERLDDHAAYTVADYVLPALPRCRGPEMTQEGAI
jgi:integrase/recombinase XerD